MPTSFTPIIDIPLIAGVCGALLLYFRIWSRTAKVPNVDLPARLPKACRRVLFLFVGILVVSWLTDVAAWNVVVAALILSMVLAIVLGSMATIEFIPAALAVLIREWAFSFPQVVLQPRQQERKRVPTHRRSKLDDSVGQTLSALRPCGEIIVDGQVYQAISENGDYIDANCPVTVVRFKNKLATVQPVWDNQDHKN